MQYNLYKYVYIYIHIIYTLWCTLSIFTCLVNLEAVATSMSLVMFRKCFLTNKYDAANISSMPNVGAKKNRLWEVAKTIAYYCEKSLQRLVNWDLEQDVINMSE